MPQKHVPLQVPATHNDASLCYGLSSLILPLLLLPDWFFFFQLHKCRWIMPTWSTYTCNLLTFVQSDKQSKAQRYEASGNSARFHMLRKQSGSVGSYKHNRIILHLTEHKQLCAIWIMCYTIMCYFIDHITHRSFWLWLLSWVLLLVLLVLFSSCHRQHRLAF